MINLDKKEINFIGYRKVFLSVSCALVVLSLCLICFKGLEFGTEFTGGSTITFIEQSQAAQMTSGDEAANEEAATVAETSESASNADVDTENAEETAEPNAESTSAEAAATEVDSESEETAVKAAVANSKPDVELTEENVRAAINNAGYNGELVVQTVQSGNSNGFLAQLNVTDVQECERYAMAAATELGIPSDDVQVSTIGPNWGASVVKTSAMAFIISLFVIIAFIWIRFRDYKMGVTAIIALLHDIIIVVGVYALAGREVTPNAVAALLTIMGYSLYDTIVVFHRINDNVTSGAVKHSFWTIANHSINQVLTRTINTTLTSLVPVLAMLFFGGATLQDFAFAMSIGLICGSYSSIAVASPVYAIWKKREKGIEALEERYGTSVITDTRVVLAGLPVKLS